MLPDHLYNNEILTYKATEWPPFYGKSATFSTWIENWDADARTTIFARYPDGYLVSHLNSRRHLALVLNKDDDTIKFSLDGELAGTLSSEAGDFWIRDSTMFDTDGDGKAIIRGVAWVVWI